MTSLTYHPITDPKHLQATVQSVFSDPDTRRGMGWRRTDDAQQALEAIHGLWEERYHDGWDLYRVHHDEDLIGFTGLGPIEDGEAWYAIYILERGEGYGSTVTEHMIQHAHDTPADTLTAVAEETNHASRALLEKHGFEPVGEAPYDWAQESELTWISYERSLDTPPA